MSENPLLSLPGGGVCGIFHDLLKFSILDADEQKLLSNFSNIPMESGKKLVRSGSSQEELLETAYKVGICSSKKNITTGLGRTGPASYLCPAAGPRRQQQFPLECPLGWKEHLVCPYGAGQPVRLLDIL